MIAPTNFSLTLTLARRLTINAVYAEPDALMTKETAQAINQAVEDLGCFIGAKKLSTRNASQRVGEMN
jgi:hypothetical protein